MALSLFNNPLGTTNPLLTQPSTQVQPMSTPQPSSYSPPLSLFGGKLTLGTDNAVKFDPSTNQLYTLKPLTNAFEEIAWMANGMQGQNPRYNYLGNFSGGGQQQPTYQRQPFTPNAATQAQLMGNMLTPQWMFDAYKSKIEGMGGNANPPVPFGITQSGFPGIGGKTAPTGGQ